MPLLPSGRVTFVFTDIEASTAMLTALGTAAFHEVLDDHDRILRSCFAARGGVEVKSEGDGLFVAFSDAAEAVLACCEAQTELADHVFPYDRTVRVRMGVQVGDARPRGQDYVALPVNQAARVMMAAHGGQVLVSDEAAAACDDRVDLAELGLFVLRDFARPQTLRQAVLAGQDHPTLPEPRTPRAAPHGVPVAGTRFVGRERLAAQAEQLVRSTRLVSLLGPGGVGKSRLAQELSHRLVNGFPDGVHYVSLASVLEERLLPAAVATAVGVSGTPDELAARLGASLAGRRMLLVLDNCEHLIDACADLAEQLWERTGVHLLTTTRERLGLAAEHVVEVAPLGEDDAALMFAERVRASGRPIALPDADVRRICHRLEGLPLAIELVAARARALDPAGIAQLIADPLALRAGRRGDGLRATIDRSHDLLTPLEQVLFRRLSVFTGGWTLAAAEQVCRGSALIGVDIAEVLTSLVDKSLVVVRHESAQTRYSMLEVVRAYAAELLRASDDGEPVRRGHRRWVLDLARRGDAAFDTPALPQWLARIDAEHANVLATLGVPSRDVAAREEQLEILTSLEPYWNFRGRPELTLLLTQAHDDSAGCADHLLARVALELGDRQRGTAQGRALLDDAVRLAAEAPATRAHALALLAEDCATSDPARCRELLATARAIVDELDDAVLDLRVSSHEANALADLGAEQGDFDESARAYLNLATAARELGSIRREFFGLINLALVECFDRSDPTTAEIWADRAAEVVAGLGERSNMAFVHAVRSLAALVRHDPTTGRLQLEQALAIAVDTGFAGHAQGCAIALAALLVEEGDLEGAAQACGFAYAVDGDDDFCRNQVQPAYDAVRAGLDEATVQRLVKRGRALSLGSLTRLRGAVLAG